MITEQVVVSRIYALPQARTASEIIAFYGQVICQQLKPTARFFSLVSKIEQPLRENAFGETVDLDSKAVLLPSTTRGRSSSASRCSPS